MCGPLFLLSACQPDATEVGACDSTSDCLADQVCVEQRCRRACNSRLDCAAGETCFGGVCLTDTSPRDAGSSPDNSSSSDVDSTDLRLTDLRSSDASAPDTAAPDASAPDTAAPDTSAPDTSAPDASAPDASAPDASAPDTLLPDHATPPPSCVDLFGELAGFLLCVETTSSCEFYQAVLNQTCDAICATAGRSCIAAYREAADNCERFETRACSDHQGDSICVCER